MGYCRRAVAPSESSPQPVYLSFVIPAYNEGEGIAGAVRRTVAALRETGRGFEVVVVDDGSADDTYPKAESIAAECPEVRVVQHPRNRGFVEAMLTGYRSAVGEVVLADAADLAFDPVDMRHVLARLDAGADVVVVERIDRAAYGLARKLISIANVALIRLLFRAPFRDYNFVQAYRRAVLDQIDVATRGVSTLATEMIIRAYRQGFVCDRVHRPYHERTFGQSSIRIRDVFHSTSELLRLWRLLQHPEPTTLSVDAHFSDDARRREYAGSELSPDSIQP